MQNMVIIQFGTLESWLSIAYFFILFIASFYLGNKLSDKGKERFLYIIAFTLIALSIIDQITGIIVGYNYAFHLPLELCAFSKLLLILFIIYRKPIFLELVTFFSLPSIFIIVFPIDFYYDSPLYFLRYWEMIKVGTVHNILIIIPIWIIKFYGVRLRQYSWWNASIYLYALYLFMSQINKIIGNDANYMISAYLPNLNHPLLLAFNNSVLAFMVTILILFYVYYFIIIKIFNKQRTGL